MYYVYIHTNKMNSKKYCGYTNNVSERWRNNGIGYKPPKNRENTRPFWNAIVKYGWDSFTHEIVLETDDKEEAKELEIYIIKELDLRNREKGYNVAEGGDGGCIYLKHPKGMLGKSQTSHAIELATQRLLENNPMSYIKWDVTHPHPRGMEGKYHSEETKKRISETLKQRDYNSDAWLERNRKLRKILKGIPKSEEHKKNLSNSRKKLFKEGKLNTNCAKSVRLVFPNGEIEIFDSIKKFEVKYKTSRTTSNRMLKSDKPYILPKGLNKYVNENLIKLVGCRLIEVE